MFNSFKICSPKRTKVAQSDWQGFFPYYAGFPETFARALLQSAKLPRDALILDPWNGSGTTTYTASTLGLTSQGFDINPVMVVVARARLLSPSEADSIEPLTRETIRFSGLDEKTLDSDEPLSRWFSDKTAATLRTVERSVRQQLVGGMTVTPTGIKLDRLSGLAATFYVALFSVCRQFAFPFLSSNPTWLRQPRRDEPKIEISREVIESKLLINLRSMAFALADRRDLLVTERGLAEIKLTDTTTTALSPDSVDMVLTSPPYCTRIDYTAATRIELAVLAPLARLMPTELSRQMLGSTRIPTRAIDICPSWGHRCHNFLEALRKHPSKASSGYYYKTHLDYFDKMSRSLRNLVHGLKPGGAAVLVVQDSFYKEIHNDLPSIVTEMCEAHGLRKRRREDFRISRSMSGINPFTRMYKRPSGSVEAVLCFSRQ